jgi:hypothetical protein
MKPIVIYSESQSPLSGGPGFGPLTEGANRAGFETTEVKASLGGKEEVGPVLDLVVLEDNSGVHILRGIVAFPEECLKSHLIWVGWEGEGAVDWDWRGRHRHVILGRLGIRHGGLGLIGEGDLLIARAVI